jgi:DNA-binding transcriptional MerR regulator
MSDDLHTLTDLARLADVTPRTIRYYVAQGLLPSPDAAGPATRYGEGHLARLRLIRLLQREHLPLAEIRGRLERMGDADVKATLDASRPVKAEPPRSPDETLAHVRALMAKAGVSPRIHAPEPDPDEDAATGTAPVTASAAAQAIPIRAIPGAAHLLALRPPTGAPPEGFFLDPAPTTGAQPAGPAPAPSGEQAAPSSAAPELPEPAAGTPSATAAPRPVAGDRSTWERLAVTADVEIHVRRPLDRLTNKRVEQLARIARELFDEDRIR